MFNEKNKKIRDFIFFDNKNRFPWKNIWCPATTSLDTLEQFTGIKGNNWYKHPQIIDKKGEQIPFFIQKYDMSSCNSPNIVMELNESTDGYDIHNKVDQLLDDLVKNNRHEINTGFDKEAHEKSLLEKSGFRKVNKYNYDSWHKFHLHDVNENDLMRCGLKTTPYCSRSIIAYSVLGANFALIKNEGRDFIMIAIEEQKNGIPMQAIAKMIECFIELSY